MICSQCQNEIPDSAARLKFEGTVDWTAAPSGIADPAERALQGPAQFCSIRCLGTFIGITLQSRGLIPPKAE